MTAIKISGVGVHSGGPVSLTILPSAQYGIFFQRTDLGKTLIAASWDNVSKTALQNTTIGDASKCVQTIEHLMAALFVCGIGSAVIEIDGAEVPILDGSAKEFYETFRNHKLWARGQKRIIVKKEIIAYRSEIIKKLPILRRIMLWFHNLRLGRRENGYVKLSPDSRGLVLSATLDYPDKIIGRQSAEFLFDYTDAARKIFLRDFAAARTFGKISEWNYLKMRGMGRGANESNVIALNEWGNGTLNKLRWPNEFVRHKIIDALGDMALAGGRLYGRLESYKGSHGLNNLVLRKLFANKSNYDIIEEN